MFGTPLEWIIILGIIIIIVILIFVMINANKATTNLGESKEVITNTSNYLNETADNVNNIVGEAEPIVEYVRNGICTNPLVKSIFGEPPENFCPSAPSSSG